MNLLVPARTFDRPSWTQMAPARSGIGEIGLAGPSSLPEGRHRSDKLGWRAEFRGNCTRRLGRTQRKCRTPAEPGDEAALPGCLHGMRRVVAADVGDRLVTGQPVQDGKAGQRRPGAPVPAGAGGSRRARSPRAPTPRAGHWRRQRGHTAARSPASGPSAPPREQVAGGGPAGTGRSPAVARAAGTAQEGQARGVSVAGRRPP